MEVGKSPDPPIFRLPAEILQHIFRKFLLSANSTRNIRLTCRYWRDLVAADRALPRRIALRLINDCRYLHYPSYRQWDHCVHTAAQLTKALECIQDSQFHLHITISKAIAIDGWDLVPWNRFSVQCSGLFISSVPSNLQEAVSGILRRLPILHNLRHLFLWKNSFVFPSSRPSVLQPIPINSPSLRSLKITWSPEADSNFDPGPFQHIFNELATFELFYHGNIVSTGFLVALLSSLWVLEDFAWSGGILSAEDISFIRESVDWRCKPRALKITANLLSVFPSSVLSELVVLEEDFKYLNDSPNGGNAAEAKCPRLHLPRLEDLTVAGSWSGLARIEAPNLQRLHIDGSSGKLEYLAQMRLNPRFVKLTDECSDQLIEAFISRGPFSNLTELHVCVQYHWGYKDGRFAQLLAIEKGKETSSVFPRLRNMWVVLCEQQAQLYLRVEPEKREEMVRTISTDLSDLPYPVSVRWMEDI
ncbi:hypothetical protein FRC14_000649 [Serendipita sp. 396]|nr:hypothetical protein FRC14_000649 [Serendipita sp. 396]KAG8775195.1 hypothetical protein FRC15_000713 [Serendipita sp. 397]KAG8791010.1 hypothetical protein FRC16_000639 [Serendipita sp. 398]KAG8855743.1 hypothetical protein FRC20_000715 [Serendipita sp. 405]